MVSAFKKPCCQACTAASVVSDSVSQGTVAPRLLCPWDSPSKTTGVGCHFLLLGIFPTQGSNPGLLYLQADSLASEPPGTPKEGETIQQVHSSQDIPRKSLGDNRVLSKQSACVQKLRLKKMTARNTSGSLQGQLSLFFL